MDAFFEPKPTGYSTLSTCDTQNLEWVDWAMKGAKFKLLSAEPNSGRYTLLIKVEKGVTAPTHRHIGAVEGYLLEGAFHYSDHPDIRFTAGSYLFESEGAVHQPVSPEGAVMFVVFHGPVEGLNRQGQVVGSIDWKWHVDAWNAAGGNYQI